MKKEKEALILQSVFSVWCLFFSFPTALSDVLFNRSPACVPMAEPQAEFGGNSLVQGIKLTGTIGCLLFFPACGLPLVQGSLYVVFLANGCLVYFLPVSALDSWSSFPHLHRSSSSLPQDILVELDEVKIIPIFTSVSIS